jgi:PKHD-type hydroxylase
MNFQVVRILEPQEINHIVGYLAGQKFVDGKLTALGPALEVKDNLQVERTDPRPTDVDQMVLGALRRNEVFQSFALARRILLPLFNRYDPGMQYGAHVDSAVMGKGADQIRTDLSMTIFLSDPESYEGGELALESPFGEQEIKLDAGEAIVYPSTMVHRVTPVTRGVRLAVVTWIQSTVRDERLRSVLFDLKQAADQAERDSHAEFRLVLNKAYNNLLRYAIEW